jgi:opacity protein-like surface antigen
MQFRLIALLVGMLLAVTGPAHAQNAGYGPGMKDRVMIPAPIPDRGAIAVPAGVPVPEGFTYYLRADLGWGFAGSRSYANNAIFGDGTDPFVAAAPFTYGSSPAFTSTGTSIDDVFLGTVGWGAYFTPHLRGDLTIDFRSKQDLIASGAYSYISDTSSELIEGTVKDTFRINSAVFLANLYLDLLPRGRFTPYVGAGVGFIYYDVTRTYSSLENEVDAPGGNITTAGTPVNATSKEKSVALAGALMAGATFAIDQHWLVDVNYRALYMGGIDVVSPIPGSSTKATIGDVWEHQARIGLRYNIW